MKTQVRLRLRSPHFYLLYKMDDCQVSSVRAEQKTSQELPEELILAVLLSFRRSLSGPLTLQVMPLIGGTFNIRDLG